LVKPGATSIETSSMVIENSRFSAQLNAGKNAIKNITIRTTTLIDIMPPDINLFYIYLNMQKKSIKFNGVTKTLRQFVAGELYFKL
jgi:hypothetical protein